MIKNLIFVFFAICFCHTVSAQGNYLSIGVGPSMIYAENSGHYKEFKFKIEPAITLSVNKQLNEFMGIKGSIGAQSFNSGGYDPLNSKYVINWGNNDQAFDFKGRGYFADLMPVLTTNPNAAGMLMSSVQFYIGLGFGVIFVEREQETLKNGVLKNGQLVEGEIITTNETSTHPYIPVRTGVSTNLSGDWDFALEFVLITTTNSELDGNNLKFKLISPDMSGQILITAKRYFGKAW
ncbi:hypothetical protein B0E43_03140 [Algoriphagus sp. A40]|nr:hypothetical protein B0E43_03140 [Algoriphagus sp. A40]